MALRRLTLITLALTGATAAMGAVRSYPLDEHIVYRIRISREEPTTCVFPEKLTALEGAGVAAKPEEAAPILVSYQTGTNHFSLRALRDDAAGALNVIFRGKVYALSFIAGPEPDRSVTFLDQPQPGAAANSPDVAVSSIHMLIERTKAHARLSLHDHELISTIERAAPHTVTTYRNFTVTVEEIFRFEAESALVFRLRFKNTSKAALHYEPQGLSVRVGSEIHPAAYVHASGAIPPQGTSEGWLVITRRPSAGGPGLTAHEPFSILVPAVPSTP